MSDIELIRAIRAGDRVAFAGLYAKHKDAVYRYACAVAGSANDAEDLVHDAFLGLLRGIERFDAERPLRPYLLASVRNRHTDVRRSFAARGVRLETASAKASGESPCDATLAEEQSLRVARALASLPASQRDVVRLRVYGELSYQEIADEHDTPVATVRTRFRAGIARLRQLLGRSVENE